MTLQALRGTGVALVTPFDKNQNVDFKALENLVNFVIDGGVEYVVALGTTGETPTLSSGEKKEILDAVYKAVNGRTPVVVGIGGNNTSEIEKDLSSYDLSKATAVLSAAPYYNKPSQEGLYEHYKVVGNASPKPVILYNVPGRTGRNMTTATTIKLANEVENIKGIKEASGDLQQCMEIVKNAPADFLVVSGDDNLILPQIACGMQGVITVAGNCFPKQFSDLVRLALDNNFDAARKIHYSLLDAYGMLFAENNPAGVKAFLYEMKLIENVLRLPVTPVSKGLHDKIHNFVKNNK